MWVIIKQKKVKNYAQELDRLNPVQSIMRLMLN